MRNGAGKQQHLAVLAAGACCTKGLAWCMVLASGARVVLERLCARGRKMGGQQRRCRATRPKTCGRELGERAAAAAAASSNGTQGGVAGAVRCVRKVVNERLPLVPVRTVSTVSKQRRHPSAPAGISRHQQAAPHAASRQTQGHEGRQTSTQARARPEKEGPSRSLAQWQPAVARQARWHRTGGKEVRMAPR